MFLQLAACIFPVDEGEKMARQLPSLELATFTIPKFLNPSIFYRIWVQISFSIYKISNLSNIKSVQYYYNDQLLDLCNV